MKKLLFAILIAIASTGMAQEIYQKDTQSQTNKTKKRPFEIVNAGYICNYVTIDDMKLQRLSYGASINIFNAHFDISVAPAKHRTSVKVGYWENESRILVANIGWRIRIAKGFGITPMIGLIRADIGDVDGWDWTVDNNGLANAFQTKQSNKYFNYGAMVDYTFFDASNHYGFKIGLVAQRYNYGALIGASFNW